MNLPGPRTTRNNGGFARSAGGAVGRGVLLVLFAVAIGVLLLVKGLDRGDKKVAAGTTVPAGQTTEQNKGKSVTTTTVVTTTTQLPRNKPSEVRVLVLNARQVNGIAGVNTQALNRLNYITLPASNAPTIAATTNVFYVDPKSQGDALGVAEALTIPAANVAALGATSLGVDLGNAQIVVVLGTDGAGAKAS